MAQITREQAAALISEAKASEIIKPEYYQSVALKHFRVSKMAAGTESVPVLNTLPLAGFVTDTGAVTDNKPTSTMAWADKVFRPEEIACIVPIHENTLADSNFDIEGEISEAVTTALGIVLDKAVLFGVSKPASWTSPALVPGAIAAGNTVTASNDVLADFNTALGRVEDNNFYPNKALAGISYKQKLRSVTGEGSKFITLGNITRPVEDPTLVYGVPTEFMGAGGGSLVWDKAQAEALVGDFNTARLAIREDFRVKVLDQATIDYGDQQINLAQKDMVAFRFTFRVAYSTLFSTAAGAATDFPFAVIQPSA